MDKTQQIKLQSSDGEYFEIDVEVAKCSMTLKMMLEHCDVDENDENNEILLPNVKANTLRKVLIWAEHHKNDQSLGTDDETLEDMDDISFWDNQFINDVENSMLIDLIFAANYLDIKRLLRLTCITLANIINCGTFGEIREYFKTAYDNNSDQDAASFETRHASGYSADDSDIV